MMVNNINASLGIDAANAKNKADETKTGNFEAALQKAADEKDEKKLKETCKNFEAIFVNMMFKQMRSTVQKSELFGNSYAEETFEDMLYDNYAQEISKGQGIGLADIMYKQLSKKLEGAEKK